MARSGEDVVDHPHIGWWIGILGGLTLLAFQGFNHEFYVWYTRHLNPLPSQAVMRWILVACLPIHIFEAVYAYRTALRLGLARSALGWSVQTFFIGYPSTHLIRRRVSRARDARDRKGT